MAAILTSTKAIETGIVYTGHCVFGGIILGTDGVNDPEITVYDGIDNSGREISPTTTYDASTLGINGFIMPTPEECATGIFIEITCAGTVEVSVKYQTINKWKRSLIKA